MRSVDELHINYHNQMILPGVSRIGYYILEFGRARLLGQRAISTSSDVARKRRVLLCNAMECKRDELFRNICSGRGPHVIRTKIEANFGDEIMANDYCYIRIRQYPQVSYCLPLGVRKGNCRTNL